MNYYFIYLLEGIKSDVALLMGVHKSQLQSGLVPTVWLYVIFA